MSDINIIDRIKLERLFDMNDGFVLDFSNRTLFDFFQESIGVDIYSAKYSDIGESKANRLRSFWRKEEDIIVSKSLFALLEYFKEVFIPAHAGWSDEIEDLYNNGLKIANRLRGSLGEHIEAITSTADDKDFGTIGQSIRQLIHENRPEEAIDRLHTYFTIFIRLLCTKHKIVFDNNKPCHSLLGEYIKLISSKGLLESLMGERILRNSISLIDSFNDVRNNKSLAHANKLLGYDESILIFRTVTSVIAFINSIESKNNIVAKETMPDELPF